MGASASELRQALRLRTLDKQSPGPAITLQASSCSPQILGYPMSHLPPCHHFDQAWNSPTADSCSYGAGGFLGKSLISEPVFSAIK